ncbi:MAG: siderophore-interacting protein, partial [Pseudomonadota bacterium]
MLKRLISTLIGTRFGTAEVRAVNHITPHMIRVTLKSDIIANFSEDCAGAHLKLVVPDKDQSDDHFADMIEEGAFKREMRTYTIRHARPSEQEIDVDIAVHGDLGRVGPWAQRTQPGDTIVISQCGSPKLITNGISRVLAGADLTSFPALAAGLETLPEEVQVEAFVEIPGPEDEQPADLPAGISINWIIKPDPHAPSDDLISALR